MPINPRAPARRSFSGGPPRPREHPRLAHPKEGTDMKGLGRTLELFGLSSLGLAIITVATLTSRPNALGVSSDDFVTGGGWITGTPSGERANFGFKAGADETGAVFGQLNYVDHSTNMHVKAVDITSYTAVNATTRQFQGTATIAKDSRCTFTATVSDAGEPGTADTFAITLSNGYSASGTLQGGNVQLHID